LATALRWEREDKITKVTGKKEKAEKERERSRREKKSVGFVSATGAALPAFKHC